MSHDSWGLELIPAVIGQKAGYTLHRLPVYHRAKTKTMTATQSH